MIYWKHSVVINITNESVNSLTMRSHFLNAARSSFVLLPPSVRSPATRTPTNPNNNPKSSIRAIQSFFSCANWSLLVLIQLDRRVTSACRWSAIVRLVGSSAARWKWRMNEMEGGWKRSTGSRSWNIAHLFLLDSSRNNLLVFAIFGWRKV